MMNKFLSVFAGLLLGAAAFAQQDRLAEIFSHLQTDRISLHVSCVLVTDTEIPLSGDVLIQGGCYRVQGGGMEIYCDGSTRWIVDRSGKEVYVESAGDPQELLAWRDSIYDIEVSELRYLPLSDDLSAFRFDTAALGSEWFVTDLR